MQEEISKIMCPGFADGVVRVRKRYLAKTFIQYLESLRTSRSIPILDFAAIIDLQEKVHFEWLTKEPDIDIDVFWKVVDRLELYFQTKWQLTDFPGKGTPEVDLKGKP